MKLASLELLRCPRCSEAQAPLFVDNTAESRDGELYSGRLRCARGHSYPIKDAIVDFIATETNAISQTYDLLWRHHVKQDYAGRLPEYTRKFQAFAKLPGPLESHFRNKIVLDAGSGEGRFTHLASVLESAHVIGLDSSLEALHRAAHATEGSPNVSLIRADLANIPLAPKFDYVFSMGVLHHLPDPKATFSSIVRLLKNGGQVSIHVNRKGAIPPLMRFLRLVTMRMSRQQVMRLCEALGFGYDPKVPRKIDIRKFVRRIGPLDVLRLRDITYEVLTTRYTSTHSLEEVVGWFADLDINVISTTPSISASGIATKT